MHFGGAGGVHGVWPCRSSNQTRLLPHAHHPSCPATQSISEIWKMTIISLVCCHHRLSNSSVQTRGFQMALKYLTSRPGTDRYRSFLKQCFPGGSDSKESACNAGDPGLIPDREDPLEKGMATHSSILAWRIPWTEEPGGRQSNGLQSQT